MTSTSSALAETTSLFEAVGAGATGPHWIRRALRQQRLGAFALAYVLGLVLAGLLAPLLATHAPGEQDLLLVLTNPSGEHWLGTDTLGRDVYSRLLYGIAPSLINSAIALAVFLVLGVPLGILAGYRGSWVDAVVSRTVELMLGIPAIIIVLVVLGVFSASSTAAMITLGVIAAPGLIRVVRGVTLVVKQELFVIAARVAGVHPIRIMSSHIIRRILGPVLVQASVFAGVSLAFQAALAFLGLTGASGDTNWGAMIAEASTVITYNTWLLLPPGAALGLTVLAFGVLGDAIRDLTSDEGPRDRSPRRRSRSHALSDAPSMDRDSAPPGAVLFVDNLSVSAGSDPGVMLVSDVSFAVRPGETVALVGESGCGKSLTALALLGLLPKGLRASSGSVVFEGDDLQAGGPASYRAVRGSGIAYVAQEALGSLDPTHTVGSHLLEVIGCHERLSAAKTRARAVELLRQVNLNDTERVLASYPHQLSGGMAQRVNIALALAGRPRLLVADEPTTALDVTVQAEILGLLRQLQEATGMAILMITHDWGVVADIADRAVVMYAGEVVERAAVDEVFSAPRFPYTAALLTADPSTAAEGARLPTLPGRVPAPGSWPAGCRFADRCAFAREECTAGPLSLFPFGFDRVTRCIRVDELVALGELPR